MFKINLIDKINGLNCLKCLALVSNGLNCSKIFLNLPKWSHMLLNGLNCSKIFLNHPKWSHMLLNGLEFSKWFWYDMLPWFRCKVHTLRLFWNLWQTLSKPDFTWNGEDKRYQLQNVVYDNLNNLLEQIVS